MASIQNDVRFEQRTFCGQEITFPVGHPHDEEWEAIVENGIPTLLIGPHGTGKTSSVRAFCDRRGYKLVTLDCPNLDPNIDLIGVPVPDLENQTFNLLRSDQIKEAEVLFFDEVNRADDRIIAALYSLIEDRRLHGELLPNLKVVIGAMNPIGSDTKYHSLTGGGDYAVNEVDDSFLDRFAAKIWIDPMYDPLLIAQNLGSTVTDVESPEAENCKTLAVCEAVMMLLDQQVPRPEEENGSYISPRKAEQIARTYLSGAGPHIFFSTLVGTTIQPQVWWDTLEAARTGSHPSTGADDSVTAAAAAKSNSMETAIAKREANAVLRKIESASTTSEIEQALAQLSTDQIDGIKDAVSATRLKKFRDTFLGDGDPHANSVANSMARMGNEKFLRLMKSIAPSRGNRDWFNAFGF